MSSYLGNPLLKAANVQITYTPEQVQEYIKCSKDPVYFIENYIKIINLDQGLIDFKLYPFQRKIVEAIHANRFTICKIPRQSGKALAATTPIFTTNRNWVTMGDLKLGDRIYAEDGSPTTVIAKTELMKDHDCYSLTFNTGETIVADAEHLWKVYSDESDHKPEIVTTEDIYNNVFVSYYILKNSQKIYIYYVDKVESVPVVCIKVNHDSHMFLAGKTLIPTHNSTTITSYLLHYTIFNPNVRVAILANKDDTAKELLHRFKISYENLPLWIQQGVIEWNKKSVQLDNGSKIIASATSASAIRGSSQNCILLDEYAYVPPNIAEDFFSSAYPVIASGKNTKVMIISTPKGMNHFYKLWINAENEKNDFVPIEANWFDVPGRDKKFKETTIANTSEKQWIQEFECTFRGSENTLISGTTLNNMVFIPPIKSNTDGLDIYEDPIKDHIYTMCVDTSRGENLDYHAITIIDVTKMPYKIVAKYRNNTVSYQVFPNIVRRLGKVYNEAYVLLELSDLGQSVADTMHGELEYPNLIIVSNRGKLGQRADGGFGGGGPGKAQMGIKTSFHTKKVGCAALKDLVETNKLIIEDFDIISELSTYVAKGVSFEATEGYFDDLVATLVSFAWLTTQEYFKDFTNTDVRKRLFQDQLKKMEESVLPFFISDGVNDVEEDDINIFDERPIITPELDQENDKNSYPGF